MKYIDIIVSILSGLAVCIPLVIKLVQYATKSVKDKDWARLVQLVMQYMAQAEELYVSGSTKKEWVMGMVEKSAKAIDYPLDDEAKQKISMLIDSACDMSKVVNK